MSINTPINHTHTIAHTGLHNWQPTRTLQYEGHSEMFQYLDVPVLRRQHGPLRPRWVNDVHCTWTTTTVYHANVHLWSSNQYWWWFSLWLFDTEKDVNMNSFSIVVTMSIEFIEFFFDFWYRTLVFWSNVTQCEKCVVKNFKKKNDLPGSREVSVVCGTMSYQRKMSFKEELECLGNVN